MIRIEERFQVPSDQERVWEVLSDPVAVVGCVPGATIVALNDDGTFDAALGVRFGPMNIKFKAHAALELDHATKTGKLVARGKDTAGGTQLRAEATFAAAPGAEGGTSVQVNGTVDIRGRLASIVEGGASVVVGRLSREFAERLADRCRTGSP